MKRVWFGGLLAATLLAGHGGVGEAQKDSPAAHGWMTNLAQAKALAKQTGKPLLVVFRCEP